MRGWKRKEQNSVKQNFFGWGDVKGRRNFSRKRR